MLKVRTIQARGSVGFCCLKSLPTLTRLLISMEVMEALMEQTYEARSVLRRSVCKVSLVPGSTADQEARGALGKSVANCWVAAVLRSASVSTTGAAEGAATTGAGEGEGEGEGISELPEPVLMCIEEGVPGGVPTVPEPARGLLERRAGLGEGEVDTLPRPAMRSLMLACFEAEVKD